MIEVRIPREEMKLVLNDERRDPEIVRRNGSALPAQLLEQPRVVMGGVLVGEEYVNAAAGKEPDKSGLVLPGSRPAGKSGTYLAEDDERHQDLVGSPESFYCLGNTPGEIDVTVRVDRDSHCQSDSST